MPRTWMGTALVVGMVLLTSWLASESPDLLSAPLPLGALFAFNSAVVVLVYVPSTPRGVRTSYGIGVLASTSIITSVMAWIMWMRYWQPEGYPGFSAEANARVERSFDVAAISVCVTLGAALVAVLLAAIAVRRAPAS